MFNIYMFELHIKIGVESDEKTTINVSKDELCRKILAVNNLIVQNRITCKVLDTPSKWFGVTYAEDRQQVVLKINELIRKGFYPQQLFKK